MSTDRYSPPPDMSAFDPDKTPDGNTLAENQAYRAGVDDRIAGLARGDCAFVTDLNRMLWEMGWDATDRLFSNK
jgi:ribosome modulation factor